MVSSLIELIDLPDEMLITIFKKLNNAEVMYSLMSVNKRLNTIVRDLTFTSQLTLSRQSTNKLIYSLEDPVLERFCLEILPEIHDKIKWLNLESLSMERILLATNYPNLCGLGLYNLGEKTAKRIFNDETSVVNHILKKQISSLVITISNDEKLVSMKNVIKCIFIYILSSCNNLRYLNFNPSLYYCAPLLLDSNCPMFISSTLQELHVNVNDYDTCLYLLDGRFNKLNTFDVNIADIRYSKLKFTDLEKLPNMKHFSLNVDSSLYFSDNSIILLLQRMPNLEKLILYYEVDYAKTFIDGSHLKKSISHMTHLKEFKFNIRSIINGRNQIDFLSNEDIQQPFLNFINNKIISCVDYFPNIRSGQCHIYSYPYRLEHYNGITNNFPGGLFKYVYQISLYDERPFEHEFFIRIQKSFPFLKRLLLSNKQPQNDKQYKKSNIINENFAIIEYSHLTSLALRDIHDDYVVQFLDDTKTYFSSTFILGINYKSLKSATDNFTIDTFRVNCDKITELCILDTDEKCERLRNYFPRACIH